MLRQRAVRSAWSPVWWILELLGAGVLPAVGAVVGVVAVRSSRRVCVLGSVRSAVRLAVSLCPSRPRFALIAAHARLPTSAPSPPSCA
eukprot:7514107-Pyramimonas_sp.AAC.1